MIAIPPLPPLPTFRVEGYDEQASKPSPKRPVPSLAQALGIVLPPSTAKQAKVRLRRAITRKRGRLVETLLRRDGVLCGICRKRMPRGDRSIDHIRPLSKGGSNDLENLRLAHKKCNSARGSGPDTKGTIE